ncbi:hypothetical protein [Nitrosospira sp. Nsp13]|uniref:hypothetical protein n=1 Tax=Nitrosospira sp. Nsp13 TaxID=1855332 RepID=UPI00088164D3|nr:hypothetical protein [Nitrosospira sp. Nsp13]SCX87695.1 hypothetical protein SAMN05216308_101680 [Nitrosospira sp. Nsp13]
MADNDSFDTERFKDIVYDLFNIEVNTILKKSISGEKMPSPRHALIDIGQDYYEILRETQSLIDVQGVPAIEFTDMRRQFGLYTDQEIIDGISDKKEVRLTVELEVEDQLGGYAAFDLMRMWADDFLKSPEKLRRLKDLESTRNLSVLPRIKNNSDMLKGMFSAMCLRDDILSSELTERLKATSPGRLTPNTVVELSRTIDPKRTSVLTNQFSRADIITNEKIDPLVLKDSEVLLVRKIWEIGTEVVAVQTTIQLDGDVIVRLNPDCMDEHPKLIFFHNEGVAVALNYWKNLITIAKEFVAGIGRGVLNKL